MSHRVIAALAAVATVAVAGCCTQPARLDPKKVAAFRDEVATVGSLAILFAPPELEAEIGAKVRAANADAELMTK